MIKSPKKQIEVALPLDVINTAAAKEKSIRHGHPSTLHLWWARRPLAAARAVLFAQMVNDPGGERGYFAGKTKEQADKEREQLFDIIRELVDWKNTNNKRVLKRAQAAIQKSWEETCAQNAGKPGFDPAQLPAFHDPFAGGGALPLEAQRLGLEAFASDLNPVAVLINKAMIEIPPRFAGQAPIGPLPPTDKQIKLPQQWPGAKGLAEDVRRYGHWMRDQAFQRIGHLYPKVTITPEMAQDRPDLKGLVGEELTIIAWLWARTVKSPNPAFKEVEVPLVSSFLLSSKKGKEVYVEPKINGKTYRFKLTAGSPTSPEATKQGTKLGRGANFKCLMSDSPIESSYIYKKAQAKELGQALMAVVAEGKRGRIYLDPIQDMEELANQAPSSWSPSTEMPENPRWFSPPMYGMTTFGDLFTPRQLLALNTFSDLVAEARERVLQDAQAAGLPDDGIGLEAGGQGATAYADAVAVYLGMGVSKLTDAQSSLVRWKPSMDQAIGTFGRQALPMVWDFAESNPFAGMAGDLTTTIKNMRRVSDSSGQGRMGVVKQIDAQSQSLSENKVISTDPPYYDNIGYADLSDFFYVWLRRSLRPVMPQLFATISVPKAEELVATPYRHGNKTKAEAFFLDGMTQAIHNLAVQAHPAFPVTIYYAFKQSETKEGKTTSTGWVTFLEAIIRAGFGITGTWPMRTELGNRMIGSGTNALASSIVLVCRKREPQADTVSRRDFQRALREEMPLALETMIGGKEGQSPIAPVDLAQAAIGPGMAVFSRYAAVLNQDGSPMSVHDALVLINREITAFLSPESGSFDADTLFCAAWFEQYGWKPGPFGEADTLARAKGTSVEGVATAGVIQSGGGKVRLLRWDEYPPDWSPQADPRLPVWEACHHLIRLLKTGSEATAGRVLADMLSRSESIRQLAYHLYTLCERNKRADDARAYNELITAWHPINAAAQDTSPKAGDQGLLF